MENVEVLEKETKPKKKISKLKKGLIIAGVSLLGVIFLFTATVYGVFFNELNALMSIDQVYKNVYSIKYDNNYFFDDFLEQGAKTDVELINFLTSKVLHGLPIDLGTPDFGCSAFTSTTAEGDNVFNRNYDFDFTPILITRTNPRNGYRAISTTDLRSLSIDLDQSLELVQRFTLLAAPYVPFDGINEKGVSMCINMVHGDPTRQDTGKISITSTTMIRLVLDKAATVDEAIALIEQYDLNDSTGGPFHYMIADASGASAVIEYIDNELKVTKEYDTYLYMTNFLIHKDANPDDYGRDRYDILTERLTETNGIMSEEESFELLKDVRMDWTDGGTVWSNVFNLDKLTMTFYPFQDATKKIEFKV